jgi:signal transduction histidine kinase
MASLTGPDRTLRPIPQDLSLGADSAFDFTHGDRGPGLGSAMSRWIGWRLRLLVAAALLGCLGLFVLARLMAATPTIDATWRADARGSVELVDSNEAALRPLAGHVLSAVRSRDTGQVVTIDADTLQRSARWIVHDAQRLRQASMHAQLGAILGQRELDLVFANGQVVHVQALPRGFTSLPAVYWLISAIALGLYLVGMIVLMARPSRINLLYALMALCQAGNLVFIATETTLALSLPAALNRLDMPLRMAFDLLTGATILQASCMHPRRLPAATWIGALGWVVCIGLLLAVLAGGFEPVWWTIQAAVTAYGLAIVAIMSWSYRIEPHPFAKVLRRFALAIVGTWVLLTIALAAAVSDPRVHQNIASVGSMIWYVFFASVLMLVPFLSRSQQLMREFSLLAAVSTVATSLDLLFVAVFSLGQFASLTLSLFVSLALYAGARQWILNQLLGSSMLTTERMFEHLYRIAREVEVDPRRTPALLSKLLRELFEPMQLALVDRPLASARVSSDGSTMLVPVPLLGGEESAGEASSAIAIRFAQRGRRLFTLEDVRLTNRIVEQLQRAVAFDKAVEQGRSEERLRLAQDLHDDIGARLLTLMYKAQSPEMEEYARHTLQDLKTLTRGLAAPSHRLSHAAAEWKADLSQRLTAADLHLGWTFEFDQDAMLSVVQWSALTRVMRELVSNAIAHADATWVDVEFCLQSDRLDLRVSDNGTGRNPKSWSHGLGLGGVRKRVKQLGGEVEWLELPTRGISCRVVIPELAARP